MTKLQKVPVEKLKRKQQGTHIWARKALIHMDGSFFRFWSEKRGPSGTWKGKQPVSFGNQRQNSGTAGEDAKIGRRGVHFVEIAQMSVNSCGYT